MDNERNPHPELERLRQEQIRKRNLQLNKRHFDIMKAIEGKDPKFAKHMLKRNSIIEMFAKHIGGGVDILEQPMCEHCEKPAAWNEGGTAYCFSCNRDTKKPITVLMYLLEYTKFYSEEQLDLLKAMGGDIDDTNKQLIL